MKCIRVISQAQPITWDAKKCEEAVDVDILGLHTVTNCARLAQRGDYAKARLYNKQQMEMMDRTSISTTQHEQLRAWKPQAQMLERELGNETRNEMNEGLDLDDDAAGEEMKDSSSSSSTSAPRFSFFAKKEEQHNVSTKMQKQRRRG